MRDIEDQEGVVSHRVSSLFRMVQDYRSQCLVEHVSTLLSLFVACLLLYG